MCWFITGTLPSSASVPVVNAITGPAAWVLKRIVAAVPSGPVGLLLFWADRETIKRVQDPVAIDSYPPANLLRLEEGVLYQFT